LTPSNFTTETPRAWRIEDDEKSGLLSQFSQQIHKIVSVLFFHRQD